MNRAEPFSGFPRTPSGVFRENPAIGFSLALSAAEKLP